jgi:hypothetical protein
LNGLDVTFVEDENEINSLYLMSLCNLGGICGNSTFAWWGAYLNNNVNKKIYFPNRWFGYKSDVIVENIGFEGSCIISTNKIEPYNNQDNEQKDMMNTTFMIPLRIDHNDRLVNIQTTLYYMTKHLKTNIIIIENGTTSNYDKFKIDSNSNIRYEFQYNDEFEFHKTKIINDCVQLVNTEVVAYCDVDCFLPVSSYCEAQNYIMSKQYDICKPYDNPSGTYGIDIKHKDKVYTHDLEFIKSISSNYIAGYGGIVFFNTKLFIKLGGMNEEFIAYGPEDIEIIQRFIKLGYKYCTIQRELYHLNHYVTSNSTIKNNYFKFNILLFEKLKSLSPEKLRDYYNLEE